MLVDKAKPVSIPFNYTSMSLDMVSLYSNILHDLILEAVGSSWEETKFNTALTVEDLHSLYSFV